MTNVDILIYNLWTNPFIFAVIILALVTVVRRVRRVIGGLEWVCRGGNPKAVPTAEERAAYHERMRAYSESGQMEIDLLRARGWTKGLAERHVAGERLGRRVRALTTPPRGTD